MRATPILILFSMLFSAWSAHATLTMAADPTGVSAYTPAVENGTGGTDKPTIYGGKVVSAGDVELCTGDGLSTCDSCDGSGSTIVPCNPRSVYNNLKVQFSLTSSEALPGGTTGTAVFLQDGSTQKNATVTSVNGNSIQFYITWADICQVTSCTSGAATNLTINLNKNGSTSSSTDSLIISVVYSKASTDWAESESCGPTDPDTTISNLGYCYTQIVRGDEKVYTDELSTVPSYPTSPNTSVKYTGLVFFYAQAASDSAADRETALKSLRNNSLSKVIPVDTTGSTTNPPTPPTVSDNRVTGLTNDSTYCFVMGNQDAAGNIFYFTKILSSSTAQTDQLCATPSKVVGLLDDKSCFIATAAFGSVMAPEVDTFRHFRNEFLLTNSWGVSFVKTYYKYSPPVANFIAQNEVLRSSARFALWPLLLFAKMSLYLGVGLTLLLLLSSSLVLTLTIQKVRKA